MKLKFAGLILAATVSLVGFTMPAAAQSTPEEIHHHIDSESAVNCRNQASHQFLFVGGGSQRLLRFVGAMVSGVVITPALIEAVDFVNREDFEGSEAGLPPAEEGEILWDGTHNGFVVLDLSGIPFDPNGYGGVFEMWGRQDGKWVLLQQIGIEAPIPPSDCEAEVKFEYECEDDHFTMSFTHTGGDTPIERTWSVDGFDPPQTTIIPVGETVEVDFPIEEGQTRVIVIDGPDIEPETHHVTRNCQGTEVDVFHVCGGLVVVYVENTSDIPLEHQIGATGVATETVLIQPSTEITRGFEITEGSKITITVLGPHNYSFVEVVEEECEPNPTVVTALECKDDLDEFHATLTNEGGGIASYTTTVDYFNKAGEVTYQRTVTGTVGAMLSTTLAFTMPVTSEDYAILAINFGGTLFGPYTVNGCGQPPTNENPIKQPDQQLQIFLPNARRGLLD